MLINALKICKNRQALDPVLFPTTTAMKLTQTKSITNSNILVFWSAKLRYLVYFSAPSLCYCTP